IYSRLGNPTVSVLEQRVAALDGGVGAVAFSSGHAAIFSTILCLAEQGDEIVSSMNIYGGAINMFGVTLDNLGITVKFVTGNNPADWEAAITDKTKAFFLEVVGNPNANVADLEPIAAVAKKHGVVMIADSTFTTPALCRPKEFGADIVIHSATKFLCGHGNSLAGIAVDCGTFPFAGNP
ncbi:MAG: aminotransferase class I/II-fold pyridoxal phosphate-dependent enzyme, partial [Angelakisella sp.]